MKSHKLKNTLTIMALAVLGFFLVVKFSSVSVNISQKSSIVPKMEKTLEMRVENNEKRREHFLRLTRNPETGTLPKNIRQRELEYAKSIAGYKAKGRASVQNITWEEVGPPDVGGRTRALGIDRRNPDIILAGGVSGGMWKSVDGGTSWIRTSGPTDNLAVTALVQDPVNQDRWFYTTGEFSGNSASARGGGALFFGSGIYISTDNGDSWSPISATVDNDVAFNSRFDFITNIAINPITETKFFASNAIGVYRSTDNFNTSDLVLGGTNEHIYSDVAVTSTGNLIAVISTQFSTIPSQTNPAGVYISSDDGLTWNNVTPTDYPGTTGRGVIGVSPSNPDIFYVFVAENFTEPNLFKFEIVSSDSASSENRTDGIPDFGPPVGDMNLQGGYNMICKVHPNNPDIVLIGGTNLFRSTDGFSSIPPDTDNNGFTDNAAKDQYWVGGYNKSNDISIYINHHPDNHALVFDPTNSDRLISAHDGGVSVTSNIQAADVIWFRVDEGYNTTQFYTVAIHPGAGDQRLVGGTQDNGSPFFRLDPIIGPLPSSDISSGDGSYAFLGNTIATVSSQNGRVIRYTYNTTGDPTNFAFVNPPAASNQLFIHPYVVNPNNEDVMFYPDADSLFRNTSLTTIPSQSDQDWVKLQNIGIGLGSSHIISTLEFTQTNPANRLYYAASSGNLSPRLFRLDNANSATDGEVNVSPPAFGGEYIHDIAVNAENGDELIAVISNYGVESIYHSADAGATWTAVGGNLEPVSGDGPSVRTAAITTTDDGQTNYFVGTSTGLYASGQLNGANTQWELQAQGTVQNSVVEFLAYRPSDKTLVVGTHGRGMFVGQTNIGVSNEDEFVTETPEKFNLSQNFPNPFNPSTTINFTLARSSEVNLTVYDLNGRKVAELLNGNNFTQGSHNLSFDASNLASGVYIYRLKAISANGSETFSQTRKMTLIK